jgi:hypothetical protein
MSRPWWSFRSLRKPVFGTLVGGLGVCCAVAWQSRPLPVSDHGQRWEREPDEDGWHQAGGLRWNDSSVEFDEAPTASTPVRLVRAMLLAVVTGAAHVAVRGLNTLHVVGDRDDWDAFQQLVTERPNGVYLDVPDCLSVCF